MSNAQNSIREHPNIYNYLVNRLIRSQFLLFSKSSYTSHKYIAMEDATFSTWDLSFTLKWWGSTSQQEGDNQLDMRV